MSERQVGLVAEHILMTRATRRQYNEIPSMPDCTKYDSVKGYWLNNGEPMVTTDEFLEGSFGSKKRDLETGEDLKGE